MIEQVNPNIPIAQQAHCGDWTVFIEDGAVADGLGRHCAISQTQFDMDTCRPVLSIELVPENGGLRGTLVLPIGLSPRNGMILQCDEAAPGPTLPFGTATRLGCIVELDFGAGIIECWQRAHSLHIKATDAETKREKLFSISLNGFSAALKLALSASGVRTDTSDTAPNRQLR